METILKRSSEALHFKTDSWVETDRVIESFLTVTFEVLLTGEAMLTM